MSRFFRDIKCYLSRKKKLALLREESLDTLVQTIANEDGTKKESIDIVNDINLLSEINDKSKPAKNIYLIKNILFFVLCFLLALFIYYTHLKDIHIRLNITSIGVNAELDESKQILIKNKLFDDVIINGESQKNNNAVQTECNDAKITLQSLTTSNNPKVYINHNHPEKIISLTIVGNENKENIGSLDFTMCKELFTVDLASYADIKLNKYSENGILESPLKLVSIYFTSQTDSNPLPASLVRTGELEFYETSHKKLLSSRDLLEVEGNGKDSLTVYDLRFDGEEIRMLIDGGVKLIRSGSLGIDNTMPTIYEYLEGQPAVIAIFGLALYLYNFLIRTPE